MVPPERRCTMGILGNGAMTEKACVFPNHIHSAEPPNTLAMQRL